MSTYVIKCPKCEKWSAKSTFKLLNYRFKCTCGYEKNIYCKTRKFTGFNIPKENIKAVHPSDADKVVRDLNKPETHLTDFFSFSAEA